MNVTVSEVFYTNQDFGNFFAGSGSIEDRIFAAECLLGAGIVVVVSICALGLKHICCRESPAIQVSIRRRFSTAPKTPHDAACIGDVHTLRKLLGGKDPNSVNADGMTCLMYASRNGHHSAVCFLLKNGADSHLVTRKGETALHLAIANCRTECADALVQQNGPINAQDDSGRTPAMCAIDEGNYQIFKEITKKNLFDPELKDRRKQTVAHYAAKTHRNDVLQSVPELNSLKAVEDVDGHTPLDLLCGAGEISLKEFDALYFSEVFESLDQKEQGLREAYSWLSYRDRAAIREKISEFGDSYLQAIERPLCPTESNSYPMGLALLKLAKDPPQAKVDLNQLVGHLGPLTEKALFIAVEKGRTAIVNKAMQDGNFGPNLVNEEGVPLAIHSLNHGQVELAEKIASHTDFDLNKMDSQRNSIVHAAARAGAVSFIRKFGDKLANELNGKRQIPLAVAVEERQVACYRPLVEKTNIKKLQKVWGEYGLTPIQYAVAMRSEPLRRALNERSIFFDYDGNPNPFYPTVLKQMMNLFSLLEEGLGLKTAELVQLKNETQAYLENKEMERSWPFSQLLLGFKHSLESAQQEVSFRKKKQVHGGSSFTPFFLRFVREHVLPLEFAADEEKLLSLLRAAQQYIGKDKQKLFKAELPIDPVFGLGLDILNVAHPLLFDEAPTFRTLVAEDMDLRIDFP